VFVVDTNVLVYAADRSSPDHLRCREQLERWRSAPEPWYLTWGIIYEFLRVTTHPRVLRRPWTLHEAWAFISALRAAQSLAILVEGERHEAVLEEIASKLPDLRGNLVHDAHTAVLMREHGIHRIVTRDMDFHRFDFLEVRDPLR
jgi:toxin-antitoxin system PIN domain toxin